MKNNDIQKLFTQSGAFTKARELAESNKKTTEFKNKVEAFVNTEAKKLPTPVIENFDKLVEASQDYGLDESFAQYSDLATDFYGEWNEEAAKMALTAYVANGGKIDFEEERVLTFGELYGLEADNPVAGLESGYSNKVQAEMEEAEFVGENRTVPVTSLKEAIVAHKLGHKVNLKEFGLKANKDGSLSYVAVKTENTDDNEVDLVVVEADSDIEMILEAADKLVDTIESDKLHLEAIKILLGAKAEDILESSEDTTFRGSTVVSNEKLAALYVNKEFGESSSALAPLVGLVRSLKISKEDFDKAKKAFSIFGASTLESLLEKAWEENSQTGLTPESDPASHTPDNSLEESADDDDLDNFAKILNR